MIFQSHNCLQIRNCNFPNNLTCDSSVKMRSNQINGNLSANGYIDLRETKVAGQLFSKSFVVAERSILGDVHARDFIKLKSRSKAGNLESLIFVELYHSEALSVKTSRAVSVIDSKVSTFILSGRITLRKAEAGSVKTKDKLTIMASIISGEADSSKGAKVSCGSIIKGTLKCCSRRLKILDSSVNEIFLREKGPIPQTVVLYNSHVECITFEKEGGLVKLIGSSSVANVKGGRVE